MIRLTKGDEPAVLAVNAANWLKVLEDRIAAHEVPTDAEKGRYRHPDIKAALIAETHGKCAYCEGKLLHIAFGDVEHIFPKSRKLADSFRWSNLTLACDVCNTYKKNSDALVDPYLEEPDEFFVFLGPMMFPIPEQAKAVVTVKQLRLNRVALLESRAKRLNAVGNIIEVIRLTQDQAARDALIDDLIENEVSAHSEYSACSISMVKAMESLYGLKILERDYGS